MFSHKSLIDYIQENNHRFHFLFILIITTTFVLSLFFLDSKLSPTLDRVNQVQAQTSSPDFGGYRPHYQGYGVNTPGGRGGVVNRVTNLNDAGPGSLRQAVAPRTGCVNTPATCARYVIFEISGYIDINSDITINSPYLTVAGQTAPSPGITIRMVPGSSDVTLIVNTHDVVFQHFRVRPGSSTCNSALRTYGGQHYNVVFDHMSASWAQDENVVIYGTALNGGFADTTFWRSIAAEGLFRAPGSGSCTGGGFSNGHGLAISTGAKNVAVLQNLFAHNMERNPQTGAGSTTYIANNLLYNDHEGMLLADASLVGVPLKSTVVGNYILGGPSKDGSDFAVGVRYLVSGSQLYLNDNTINIGSSPDPITPFIVIGGNGTDPRVGTPPVTLQIGRASCRERV